MQLPPLQERPRTTSYDVVIIGGAIMGSSAAWFLSDSTDFNGRVLVVERRLHLLCVQRGGQEDEGAEQQRREREPTSEDLHPELLG